MPQRDRADRPRLVYKESLILGVGVGLFVQESVGAGEVVALPALTQPVEEPKSLAASVVAAPPVEVRESLIAGVGLGLFAVTDLVPGDVVSVPSAKASAPMRTSATTKRAGKRRLLTLDDADQRRKHGAPTIVVRESLIAGVGLGAFAADDFEPGDVLGALDEAKDSWNEPFETLFSTAPAPAGAPVLDDWTHLVSAPEMQSAHRAMLCRNPAVPDHGWLRLTKKQLMLLLENDDDDTILNVPLSIKSLALRLRSDKTL
ncbi:hypothetical protein SDRG_15401 [Saprolegnia diclina VS20]|uniref:SET domain-containing protein n=1 Tax=Saprolegnia diclina (strain VS20) TaxID=1156394 RepID=T0PWW7_SAPDV|nr:hypothetical protein SDRG_15401 [Saprolegnia diclina VS20]EQC26751.1 hypothetical protein SDRG_15401 [Saprolegnia diclina VS20]|eukprot:XP_008619794.1 hypothetical protein SDRG_15401 [Saprolegnia diclina VS20]